jgi:type 1 glutamine amidotransferase
LYNQEIDRTGTPIHVLATAYSKLKNTAFPSIFVVEHPKARIVGIALGHDGRVHDLPVYHQLLKNSVLWVAGR